MYLSKKKMEEEIVTLLGGRVAEKLVLNDISTGASNDLERATSIAKSMVMKYGMSDALGPVVYDSGSGEVFLGRDYGHTKSYSEKVAAEIDEEIKRIVEEAYERCRLILEDNMDILTLTAEYLLRHEVMDGDTFAALCRDRALPEEKEPEAGAPEAAEAGEVPAQPAEAASPEAQGAEKAQPEAEAGTMPPDENRDGE